jgi:hypothetical protein
VGTTLSGDDEYPPIGFRHPGNALEVSSPEGKGTAGLAANGRNDGDAIRSVPGLRVGHKSSVRGPSGAPVEGGIRRELQGLLGPSLQHVNALGLAVRFAPREGHLLTHWGEGGIEFLTGECRERLGREGRLVAFNKQRRGHPQHEPNGQEEAEEASDSEHPPSLNAAPGDHNPLVGRVRGRGPKSSGNLAQESLERGFRLLVSGRKRRVSSGRGNGLGRRRRLDGGHETVPGFPNRLDVRGVLRIVVEHLSELGDAPREDVVCDDRVPPYNILELLLRDRFARSLGHAQQNLHDLRLNLRLFLAEPKAIAHGFDKPFSNP